MKRLTLVVLFLILLGCSSCSLLGESAGQATYDTAQAVVANPPPGARDAEGQPVSDVPNTPAGWIQWAAYIIAILAAGKGAEVTIKRTTNAAKSKKAIEKALIAQVEPAVYEKIVTAPPKP